MQERKEENAMCAAWWKERVFYQIYPRSFQDSNGDGIGDIPGIISRLDYLKWLGVGAVWLCPVYDSPNADMGYDIRDYEKIMSEFGTMEDFDTLLREMHKQDIKLVMDLVVNHSSDEHPWFVESRKSLDNPCRDYYIWRDGKNGKEPNNWSSFFTPSAWSYDEKTGQWYLHLFSEKQPDLNWENPKLREAVYAMMNRWFDRGVDGFRMDVISLIAKAPGLPDGQGDGYVFSPEQFAFQPKLHEYLREMRRRCFDGRNCMCVGETTFVTPENADSVVGDGRELDLLFQFDFMDLDGCGGKWNVIPFDLRKLKQLLVRWQEAIDWNTLFWGNHDQPRAVSRFGSDASEALRVRSAKMLAAAMYLLRGTPFLYQGEEISMTNFPFRDRDAAPRCGEPQSARAGPEGRTGSLGVERHPQKRPRQCAYAHAVGCFRQRGLHSRNAVDRCESELPADQRARSAGRPGFDPALLPEAAGAAAGLGCAAQRNIPPAPAGAPAASRL